MSDAVPLIIKVLSKSMDTSLSPDKVELSTITRDPATGQVRGARVCVCVCGWVLVCVLVWLCVA